MLAFTIVVPFLSLLAGAGFQYWLNNRQRERTYVDDLFKRAIEAVFAADASVEYPAIVGRPDYLSDEAWLELRDWFVTQAMQQWWTRQAEANEALARIRAYEPQVANYLPFRVSKENRDLDDLVALLKRREEAA